MYISDIYSFIYANKKHTFVTKKLRLIIYLTLNKVQLLLNKVDKN